MDYGDRKEMAGPDDSVNEEWDMEGGWMTAV